MTLFVDPPLVSRRGGREVVEGRRVAEEPGLPSTLRFEKCGGEGGVGGCDTGAPWFGRRLGRSVRLSLFGDRFVLLCRSRDELPCRGPEGHR